MAAREEAWFVERPFYMPDYARAFAALGFATRLVPRGEVERCLREATARPAFLVDSTPRSPIHALARDRGVAVVGLPLDQWYHSPRVALAPYEPRAGEHLVFTLAPEQVAPYRAAGFPHVEHLLFGVDAERFRPLDLDAADRGRFGADVCFIGSSLRGHDPPDSFSETIRATPGHAGLHRALEAMAARVVPFDYRMPEILTWAEGTLGLVLGAEPGFTPAKETWCIRAGIKLSELERQLVVEALASPRFALYGSRDWLEQLGAHPAAAAYRGEVDWATDLPKAMCGATVNVNVSKAMFSTGVGPRVFETLACGRLMLSNPIPAVMELFEDGVEAVYYRTVDELVEKARFYAAHPTEASRIGARGREKVVALHTTAHRAGRIVQVLEERGIVRPAA